MNTGWMIAAHCCRPCKALCRSLFHTAIANLKESEPEENCAVVEADLTIVEATLRGLSDLMADDSPAAVKHFGKLKKQLGGRPGLEAGLQELERQISDFEFEQALPSLEKLATKLGISLGN